MVKMNGYANTYLVSVQPIDGVVVLIMEDVDTAGWEFETHQLIVGIYGVWITPCIWRLYNSTVGGGA